MYARRQMTGSWFAGKEEKEEKEGKDETEAAGSGETSTK